MSETATANVTYVAQWTANTDTAYTVEYYYQADGKYPETATSSVKRSGTTDATASVTEADKTPNDAANYAYDTEAGNVESGTIAGDGGLVLKVYFKQQIAVTYAPGAHGTFEAQTTTGLDYGEQTPAFDGETTGEAGWTFAGWTPTVSETATANVTYVAQWTANFFDFSITGNGESWTYDSSARYIDVNGVYPGDAVTYDFGEGKVINATVNSEGAIEGAPRFMNVDDSAIVAVTVKRGDQTASAFATMTISPREVIITTGSAAKVFDGTALTAEDYEITSGSFVDGETFGVDFGDSGQIAPGASDNLATVVFAGEGNQYTAQANNYSVTVVPGTLLVYPQSIDPEDPSPDDPDPENPDQPFYNGVKVTGPKDVDYNGLSQQLPPTVTDRNDNPLDPNYYDVAYSDDTVNTGTVTITVTGKNGYTGEVQVTYQIKKVGLTITTPDAGKVYDGTPLQNQVVQADGWKDNDASQVTLAANGSITEVGSTLNTYVATDPDNVLRNYNITEDLGTLTVWPQSIDPEDPDPDKPDPDDPDPTDPDPDYDPDDPDPEDPDQPFYTGIKVQGPDPQVYDAADQTPGVVVTDKNGKVLEEGTDYRITGYDNNYNVTTEDSLAIIHVEGMGNYGGSIDVEFEIIPAPLKVTTPSAGKVYDGSALTAGPADVEGLQGSDATAVTITATGTQTDVGNSVNGVSYDWGQVLASNYSITEDLGTLTVWPQSIDPTDPGEDPDPDDPDAPDPSDPDPDFPGEDPDPDNPVVPDQPFYTGAEVNAPQDVSYNGADQTWAPTVTDAEGNLLTAGEDYEVSYSTDDRTNVTGDITVTITGKGNYAGAITREYQITPLEIDVYIENQTKVEGEADPTFTFNYEGVLEGESMGWTGAFVRDAGEAAGTYNVAQGGFVLADNEAGNFLASNYTLTVHPGTLTITAAPVPPGPDTPVTPVTPLPTPDPTPVPTPTPGDPGATGTPETPATEEATETIEDDATPRTAPEPINDDGTPLASGAHRDCWVHWLMLLGILVTVVYYGGVGVRRVRFSSSLQSFEDDVLGNDETNR